MMDSLRLHDDDDDIDPSVKSSFKDTFRQLWNIHINSEKGLKSKLHKFETKVIDLERTNESLNEDIRWMAEKMDLLKAANARLQAEVQAVNDRPPPTCINCAVLKRQVENLTAIGDNIMSLLSYNKRFTHTLQTMYTQALDSEVLNDTPTDALTQALTEALYEEPIPDTEKPPTNSIPAESKVERILNTNKPTILSIVSMNVPGKHEEGPSPNKIEVIKTRSPTIPLCKLKEVDDSKAKCDPNIAVSSPQHGHGNPQMDVVLDISCKNSESKKNLKLARNHKRHRFTEADQPNSKRFRGRKKIAKDDLKLYKNESKAVIAIDTHRTERDQLICPEGHSTDSDPHGIVEDDDINLVIPETVAINFSDEEDEVVEIKISTKPNRNPAKPNVIKNRSQSNGSVNSEPTSPVFMRNMPITIEGNKPASLQSPSLFDEDDPKTPTSNILLPEGPEFSDGKRSGLLGDQSKQGYISNKQQVDKSQEDVNSGISISLQSIPSPSMLSEKIVSKCNDARNTGWFSKNNSVASPCTQKQSQWHSTQQSKVNSPSSQRQNKAKGQLNDDVNLQPICSQIRTSRRKSKKISQDNDGEDKSVLTQPKALKQSTLSQMSFQKPKTFLPNTSSFNGGKLSQRPLTREEKELLDIDEAMKRSLSEVNAAQSEYEHAMMVAANEVAHSHSERDFEVEVEMTGPQFTSTPCAQRGNQYTENSTFNNMLFKKPPAPTTPAYNHPMPTMEHDMYHSPYIKDMSEDQTIDPNQTSPQGKRTPRQNSIRPQRKHLSMNENSACSLNESISRPILPPNGNGSIDPDFELSELDLEISNMHRLKVKACVSKNKEIIELESFGETRSENQVLKKKQSNKLSVVNRDIHQSNLEEKEEEVALSATSVLFKSNKTEDKMAHKDSKETDKLRDNIEDSFDILPKKKSPGFAHVDVVRKRAEREQLQTYACPQCLDYYRGADLHEEEIKERMRACRHKARYVPPGTPDHYWDIGFPDTQECEERGYLKKTQGKPSNFRRTRGLRKLFKSDKETKPTRPTGEITTLFEGDDSIT